MLTEILIHQIKKSKDRDVPVLFFSTSTESREAYLLSLRLGREYGLKFNYTPSDNPTPRLVTHAETLEGLSDIREFARAYEESHLRINLQPQP